MASFFESFRGVFRSKSAVSSSGKSDNNKNEINVPDSDILKKPLSDSEYSDTQLMKSESVEANLDSTSENETNPQSASRDEESPYVSEVNSAELSLASLSPALMTGLCSDINEPLQGLPPRKPQSALLDEQPALSRVNYNQGDELIEEIEMAQKEEEDAEIMATLMALVPCQITQSRNLFSKSFASLPKPVQSKSSQQKIQMTKKSSTRVFYDMAEIGVVVSPRSRSSSISTRPQTSPQLPVRETDSVQREQTNPDNFVKAIDESETSTVTAAENISTVDEQAKENNPKQDEANAVSQAFHVIKKEMEEHLNSTTPKFSATKGNTVNEQHKLPTKSRSESFEHVQSVISNIISEEGDDFKEKYSDWIAEVFHEKMETMRQRLDKQFNLTLVKLESEKNEEIQSLQNFYQKKIKLLETSSHQFQQLIKTMEFEHRRTLQGKDDMIGKLSNELNQAGQKYSCDLEKERTLMKAEMEREKTELMNQQGEHLQRILGSIATSESGSLISHGDSFLSKDFLNCELNNQNRGQVHSSEGNVEIDALYEKIATLQKTMESANQEKAFMSKLHKENLSNIMNHSEQSIQELTKRFQSENDKLTNLKKRHEREMKDMKIKMLNKETFYNKTFIELKRKYGDRIDELARIIQKIESTYSY